MTHSDTKLADQALDAAVGTIRHVEAQMSLFDANSALSRLNRDGVLHDPHPDLVSVFQRAQFVSARSQGAFDVTVQPLWMAFETTGRGGGGNLPSPVAVQKARAAVGWQRLAVSDSEIRLRQPGMAVTLNGIAQGFAADLVKARLQTYGVRHAPINTGEWASLGRSDQKRPWLLGIANPREEQAFIARQ